MTPRFLVPGAWSRSGAMEPELLRRTVPRQGGGALASTTGAITGGCAASGGAGGAGGGAGGCDGRGGVGGLGIAGAPEPASSLTIFVSRPWTTPLLVGTKR